jgi:hypothetical protein
MNVWRLLVMRHPALSPADEAAFDELLARTPEEGTIEYALEQPKWWFLHHQIRRGYLVHGSNEAAIDEFRTRQNLDAHQRPVEAVFASDDAIWPLYFAVVNRPVAQSYINWCEHVTSRRLGSHSRYLFSIGSDPRDERSWTNGTIYLLPSATFRATPESRELVSERPVRPRARLPVAPGDFPLRSGTRGHGRGASVRSVVWRNALRMPGLR